MNNRGQIIQLPPRYQLNVIRFDEGLTLEASAFQIFHGSNSTFINSFDKTKFSCFILPPTQHHNFSRNQKFVYLATLDKRAFSATPYANTVPQDVINTGNGQRKSGNECTAVTRLRIQNGGRNDAFKHCFLNIAQAKPRSPVQTILQLCAQLPGL